MFTVTEIVSIARPVHEVFEYLTDARNRPQWDSTVLSEELTSAGPLGVGSTIHTRLQAMGRDVDFDWQVTQFDRPTKVEFVSVAGPIATQFRLELSEVGTGCDVHASIDATPSGLMSLVQPVIAEAVRGNLATSLARAKTLLEEHPLS